MGQNIIKNYMSIQKAGCGTCGFKCCRIYLSGGAEHTDQVMLLITCLWEEMMVAVLVQKQEDAVRLIKKALNYVCLTLPLDDVL